MTAEGPNTKETDKVTIYFILKHAIQYCNQRPDSSRVEIKKYQVTVGSTLVHAPCRFHEARCDDGIRQLRKTKLLCLDSTTQPHLPSK